MDPRRKRTPAGISGGRRAIMPVEKAKDIRYTLNRLWDFFLKKRKKIGLFTTFLLVLVSGVLGLLVPFFYWESYRCNISWT